MNCKFCEKPCQKWGRQKNGRQRFYCKTCKKCQQEEYKYAVYKNGIVDMIPRLIKESVSIRGIGRLLGIALATVLKKIKWIAAGIIKPPIPMNRSCFELDEVRTFIARKQNECWVAYALCSETKQVVDFVAGKRSKRILSSIVNTLLLSKVRVIKTDKLNIYQSLIPRQMHQSAAYNTNHIERNNLNLRTHLKRLSRRTICFSRSLLMLECCLKIYFWYESAGNRKELFANAE